MALQIIKGAVSRTFKILFTMVKYLLKLCFTIVKVLLAAIMLSAMIFGGLSAFLAVGPMHTPTWMAQAWNMLNEVDPARLMDALDRDPSPLWEVRDPAIIISRWMVQFQPVADLLATGAGVAKDHWLRAEVMHAIQHVDSLVQSEPKFGQAVAAFWVISLISSLYLMLRLVLGTLRMFGRSLRRLVRAVCPARATTTEVGDVAVPDGAGTTPKATIANAPPALGENTRSNIVVETMMTSQKNSKTSRRRLESPHLRPTQASKEDVPPSVASPVRRKHSELSELREQGLVGRRLRGN